MSISAAVTSTSTNAKDVVQAISNTVTSGGHSAAVQHLNGVWSRFYKALYSQAISVWPQVLTGVFILLVFWLMARLAKYLIVHMAKRSRRRREIYNLLGKCVKVTIIIIGVITALGTMGINVTALVTGLGLSGFAIGLALKDPISNAISGFMVLLYEPFKVGDEIEFAGTSGTVKDIQLRYTIVDADEKRYLIPNANLLTNTITVNNELIEPIKEATPQKKKSRSHKSS